ncbi:anti-sigma-I factor RsgI family protein [Desulforudis sp. DRI-14]|uniref:anti-sigma-I factor RsgI family protein n=1 Tax=Desulforudis sp. DRI-14 TaxID=3459793 RepID=UPI004042E008
MTKVRGIVLRVRGRWMWVATANREFLRLPVPAEGARPGEEIWAPSGGDASTSPAYRGMLVAGILVLLVIGAIWANIIQGQDPAVYLAFDVNPSLELSIDTSGRVIDIAPFNQDAATILKDLSFKGEDVYETIEAITLRCQEAGYISPGRKNTVLLTVTPVEGKSYVLDAHRISKLIIERMKETGVEGTVGIQTATSTEREESRRQGISLNSYLLIKKASARGCLLPLAKDRTGVAEILQTLTEQGLSLEQLITVARVGVSSKEPGLETKPVTGSGLSGNLKASNHHHAAAKRAGPLKEPYKKDEGEAEASDEDLTEAEEKAEDTPAEEEEVEEAIEEEAHNEADREETVEEINEHESSKDEKYREDENQDQDERD